MLANAVSILLLVAVTGISSQSNCPLNEVFYNTTDVDCDTVAAVNLKNSCSSTYTCSIDCFDAFFGLCICAPGYCRDCRGNCIPQNYGCCANQNCKPDFCPANERYCSCPQRLCDSCPGPVEFPCDQTQVCRGGCTCVDGYLRLNGVCVPQEKCPPLRG